MYRTEEVIEMFKSIDGYYASGDNKRFYIDLAPHGTLTYDSVNNPDFVVFTRNIGAGEKELIENISIERFHNTSCFIGVLMGIVSRKSYEKGQAKKLKEIKYVLELD